MSDRRRQYESDYGGRVCDPPSGRVAVPEDGDRVVIELRVLARILIEAMKEHMECGEVN